MLDKKLKNILDPHLNKVASYLGRIGIGANQITIYGFAIGMVGCIAIGLQSYLFGIILILLNRLADGIDGAVARYNAADDTASVRAPFYGEYLDTILDMILFGAFIFLFVLGQPHHAVAGLFVAFSYIGLFGTSLGQYITATKASAAQKSYFHPTRLIEETEIVIFMILVCLYPAAFSAIAALFGLLCWVTTLSRIWSSYFDVHTGQDNV